MNNLSDEKVDKICEAIWSGLGIRETSRLTGVHRSTVSIWLKYFTKNDDEPNRLEFLDNYKCKCGKPPTHQGWCFIRFKKSTKRQEFMKKWKKTNQSPPPCGSQIQ